MELFSRRYLCFICFIFLFVSVLVFGISSHFKILMLLLSALLCIGLALFFAFSKKKRFAVLVSAISFLAASVALFNSWIFVSIPIEKASQYDGTYTAELEIISSEYSDALCSEYNARLLQIGSDEVNIKSYLVCDFDSNFSYGDRIVAVVDSEIADINNYDVDKDIVLFLRVDVSQPIMYAEENEPNIVSFDWLRSKTMALRTSLCAYIDEIFDTDGALVKGMLINEKSDISAFSKSQFRRSGASHLLAVSGLHISLLLGALEILLRRVLVPKKVRIFIILIAGTVFVGLTDFSPSALRATLMLFAVYLNYMLAEENDSVTSLFVSVGLITLFSPFSVSDIGLWLSFFATLGLVTVYPYLHSKISAVFKKFKKHKKLFKILRIITHSLLLTVVANVFVLPLMWYFFGEMSLTALPCNLLLSPLTALFLPACVLSLIFGKITFLGDAIVLFAKLLGSLILATVNLFADMRFALVSLEYPFASVLVVIFAISMAILMVVKLRQKMLICLPCVAFAISFVLSLLVFTLSANTQIYYAGRYDDEIILSERAGRVSVCDMSAGSAYSYWLINDNLPEYSTEIENYIITDISASHATMLKRIYNRTVIRNIYIPIYEDRERILYSKELFELAAKYNTGIHLYGNNDTIALFNDLNVSAYYGSDNNLNEQLVLCFYNEDRILTYSGGYLDDSACLIGAESQYFLIGAHSECESIFDINSYGFSNTRLIFADKGFADSLGISDCYVPRGKGRYREFLVVLE